MKESRNIRSLFVPCDDIYLVSHSVGRPLVTLSDEINRHFLTPWEMGQPWKQWLKIVENFKEALARLFNSQASQFCPQINLSSALTKVVYSFPFLESRPVILLSEKDFPSIGFVLQQATRSGYDLRFIPEKADLTDPDVWKKHLADDVRFVMITHVHFNTGHHVPLDKIIPLAKARGILSIVDIAQSAGVIPIDLACLDPDIVIGTCIKWLCGGPGAGFIWMDKALITKARPIDVGWFSHQNPFEFDLHHFVYNSDASRFMGGTPSVLPYAIAEKSISQLVNIGIKTIREHNIALSEQVIERVEAKYLISPKEQNLRGGTLVLNFQESQLRILQTLQQSGITVDERSAGLRISFHIYNTSQEVNVLLETLERCHVLP